MRLEFQSNLNVKALEYFIQYSTRDVICRI